VWGQHLQMMGIWMQECRAIELAHWRSRVSGSMKELSDTASVASSTMAELRKSQSHMAELAATTLHETQVRCCTSDARKNNLAVGGQARSVVCLLHVDWRDCLCGLRSAASFWLAPLLRPSVCSTNKNPTLLNN
jgi:hypothetical protein